MGCELTLDLLKDLLLTQLGSDLLLHDFVTVEATKLRSKVISVLAF